MGGKDIYDETSEHYQKEDSKEEEDEMAVEEQKVGSSKKIKPKLIINDEASRDYADNTNNQAAYLNFIDGDDDFTGNKGVRGKRTS